MTNQSPSILALILGADDVHVAIVSALFDVVKLVSSIACHVLLKKSIGRVGNDPAKFSHRNTEQTRSHEKCWWAGTPANQAWSGLTPKHPNGSGEYQDILNSLAEDDRPNDAEWLMDRAGADSSLIEVDSIDNVKPSLRLGRWLFSRCHGPQPWKFHRAQRLRSGAWRWGHGLTFAGAVAGAGAVAFRAVAFAGAVAVAEPSPEPWPSPSRGRSRSRSRPGAVAVEPEPDHFETRHGSTPSPSVCMGSTRTRQSGRFQTTSNLDLDLSSPF